MIEQSKPQEAVDPRRPTDQEEQVRDYTQNESAYRNHAKPIQKVLRKYLIASTEAEDMHQAMEVENNATEAILALVEKAYELGKRDATKSS